MSQKGRHQNMHVYVLNKHGKPLMPCKPRKARVLLQSRKATVVKRTPFTIQLKYGSSGYKQPISLGMDAGSKYIGIVATTKKQVLYAEELEPRNDMVKLLSVRRQNRRTRRNRKTRYRQARFDNRVHSKHKGEMHDSYNVRQYVLKRDNYTCQCCGAKNVKFHVHHKETRQTGGNSPNNLITLCEDCHKAIHLGKKELPSKKTRRSQSLRDAAFMGIMRQTLLERLRNQLEIPVTGTYGYITKMYREMYNIKKSHINDAIVISKNFRTMHNGTWYKTKAIRHHNRQIHKNTILKGGKRKLNQAPHVVKGYRLNDVVQYKDKLYFIYGRRLKRAFVLSDLDKHKLEVTPTKLKFINASQSILAERR